MPNGYVIMNRVEPMTGMRCAARFSPDLRYRYTLAWIWETDRPMLVAWMLNPSTATHEVLDPTVAGLVKRAQTWGMGGVEVINLFAFRATEPKDMKAQADPVGPLNDDMTRAVLLASLDLDATVVCAWGKHGRFLDREAKALAMAREIDCPLHFLKLNGDGTPAHPLYLPHALKPTPWEPANAVA